MGFRIWVFSSFFIIFFNFCDDSLTIFLVVFEAYFSSIISNNPDFMRTFIIIFVFVGVDTWPSLMISPLISFMMPAFMNPPLFLMDIVIFILALNRLMVFSVIIPNIGWFFYLSVGTNVVVIIGRLSFGIIADLWWKNWLRWRGWGRTASVCWDISCKKWISAVGEVSQKSYTDSFLDVHWLIFYKSKILILINILIYCCKTNSLKTYFYLF